jgi:hypothetical protein
MHRLRRLLYAVFTLVLTLAVVWDVIFALELVGHFFSGGLRGVNDWIVHIGTEGRIRMVQTGPGTAQVWFPSEASVFGGFAATCVFLVFVTIGSWWGRQFFESKKRISLGE